MEKRGSQRRHLLLYLKVFDRNSGKLLGVVADISLEGVLILSETPIGLNQTFDLEIDPGESLQPRGKANPGFTARSLWAEKDANPKYTITGFKFIAPDPVFLDAVRKLIETLGFMR
ncbi:MAG: PilZ domain-containing protein [Desulfobacteraceae bacterium]|nr:MAG: PilZ domain-containing protein [Desulfobacteraceae bacterium]